MINKYRDFEYIYYVCPNQKWLPNPLISVSMHPVNSNSQI